MYGLCPPLENRGPEVDVVDVQHARPHLQIDALTAAGLAAVSSGCYTVKPVTFESFGGARVKQVWVTRSDNTQVLIRNADISGDELRGYIDGQYKQLPAADLKEIRVRQLHTGRTLALVLGGAAAMTAVFVAVSGTDDSFDPCAGNPRCDEDTPP